MRQNNIYQELQYKNFAYAYVYCSVTHLISEYCDSKVAVTRTLTSAEAKHYNKQTQIYTPCI